MACTPLNVDKSVEYLEEQLISLQREVRELRELASAKQTQLSVGTVQSNCTYTPLTNNASTIVVDGQYLTATIQPCIDTGNIGGTILITLSDAVKQKINI